MKIICTNSEKKLIFNLLLDSDRCIVSADCNGRICAQCLSEEIEWVIEPEREET